MNVKRCFIILSILILNFMLSFNSIAEILSHSVSYNTSDLRFSQFNEFDIITMKNLGVNDRTGSPQLPVDVLHFFIPSNARVEGISIVKLEKKVIAGNYNILPVQKAEVLSRINDEIEFTKPDKKIYQSNLYYPDKIIEYKDSGFWNGFHIASFFIYPVQYLPAKETAILHSNIEFNIHLEPTVMQTTAHKKLSLSQNRDVVRKFVQNSDDLSSAFESINQSLIQYIIITKSSYADYFQPLAAWKHKKGVPAKIVTVDTIYSTYEGRDEAEKVRNFIKYAYENWGTTWVLLGGDTEVVPHRRAFAMDCKFSNDPDEDNIPCDLYFSDLDGSWDFNHNNIFGEVADSVDLYPEVFVGRAPVDNIEEVTTFVNKVLTYEKTPPLGYQKNMLFAAELLWKTPYTNTGIGKDMIEAEYLPADFYNITKLYEDLGNESKSSVISALNNGQHIFNHDGHAYTTIMSVGANTRLRISDMNNLSNGSMSTICFSIGCYPANFEKNCIAESFLNNPNGGGIAFIGNSRYGWGSPGNPGYGYSDRFDSKFFKYLFQDKNYHIGQALALAKMFHIPYAQQENVYRWCMYEINLLGDPEIPVWTDVPQTLVVSHPEYVPTGESEVTVTVTQDKIPIVNALVCLMQNNNVYVYGKTGQTGQISFPINPTNAATDIEVTVTALNFLPYEGTIDVSSDQAYVAPVECTIDDVNSNHDGLLNPGETVSLNIMFKNYGNQLAEGVTAVLTADDSLISVENGAIQIGNIAAHDSVTCENAFKLTLDSEFKNGQIISLNLQINASGAHHWNEILPITVATPVISFNGVQIDDANRGNGNGVPEPGESLTLLVSLINRGFAPAQITQSPLLATEDPYVKIISQSCSEKKILLAGQTTIDSFQVTISDSCPIPRFCKLFLDISTDDNQYFLLCFKLSIGQLGFSNNVETGIGNWTIDPASANLWHISTIRSHSPAHSWYCGREEDTTYTNNNQSILYSPNFYLGANAKLSFWLWFDVAIYSKWGYEGDGIYVELYDGTDWHTLDFIGTGGALTPILMGSDWCQYNYDLSSYPIGRNAQLRFKFISDPFWADYPDPHEGIYLDDIKVTYDLSTHVQQKEVSTIPENYVIKQNYPNPFNQSTIFEYQIAGKSLQHVKLRIFNILGQEIKTLVNKRQVGGRYTIYWDGRDEQGVTVASGVYVYLFQIGEFKKEKKLVILR